MSRPLPESEFLKPTMVGIGVGTCTVALLTLLLLMLAVIIDAGGRAVGTEGNGAGRGTGDGFGAFETNGGGGGDNPSSDDSIPGKEDEPPTEISDTRTNEKTDERPQTAAASTQSARQDSNHGLSGFLIAALPELSSGEGRESGGSGSGFSDVGDRLDSAGAKSGDVQISLAWNNGNDLDLHVIAPSGERIYYSHKQS
ncbi:MAG: hypothetical protein ABGZ35_10715, partial [Planctomycetaceae bacterium]